MLQEQTGGHLEHAMGDVLNEGFDCWFDDVNSNGTEIVNSTNRDQEEIF